MINHIDIVIPCFNVEHIVDKCIESVLKQECEQNISIYLIEDGSTDNTKGVLLRFSTHSKINIIFHTKNKGIEVPSEDWPNKTMCIVMNNGLMRVVEEGNTIFPNSLIIDYLRVYEKN